MTARARLLPAVGATVAAALLLALGVADPARADTYPTWPQVLAAQRNAAAAHAELQTIQSAVAALQAREDAASAAELSAQASASAAAAALQQATTRLNHLHDELAAARKQSAAAAGRFVTVMVQLDRLGGAGDVTAQLLAAPGGGGDLLARLDAMSQLSRRTATLEAAAVEKKNLVGSLERQASTAQRLQVSLTAEADAALAVAQAARATADAALAAARTQNAVLAQQAKALDGTASAVEADWQRGQAEAGSKGGTAAPIGGSAGGFATPAQAQAYARQAIVAYGWGSDQFSCLVSLWNMESGWHADAYNTSSGAYGIPQAYPAEKMQTAGADWRTNADTQIDWGLAYIQRAYGSPCGAWNFEMSHTPHWY